ncbi:GlcG/HbpS family heme-binding protein [Antarcticirhabdus aurantiaca]|uniref:Heme-binding protein n=1 Tax=Antarcticirhabdus aurantiaca TaxID=2606717 RepID=A0ACD4NJI1_9HYPH|nr:heme-binding protein [Antarcticirhabdus aurantiaca]WAJ26948.1 heme-binding protein [Jeongeuplla avenae]
MTATRLDLDTARRIISGALFAARSRNFKPLTVAVLDAGGALVALEREDGSSPMRPAIAIGKANGAVQMGLGSRALMKRAEQQPFFIQSMNALAGGSLVPVPGGVLLKSADGVVLGAVGVTGDTSDNDEIAALAGAEAAGLHGETG